MTTNYFLFMERCQLCQERPADKSNTHFLTDGVIRNCLNEDGSNIREKALAFNISLDKDSIEARFQRNTSQKSIQKTFGREASEEEIIEAKKKLFSVDYVFRSECEQKFTDIETPFLNEVLPKLREKDFTGQKELILDSELIRKFFLLQVYRTAVSDPEYQLSEERIEALRRMINNVDAGIDELNSIPLQVTYLNTLGSDYEYTKNTVGTASNRNNRVILFNDFIIQTSANNDEIEFSDFWRLNDKETFKYFTNYKENNFRIKIVDNKQRLEFYDRYHKERAKKQVAYYRSEFIKHYVQKYYRVPNIFQVKIFINSIINSNEVDEPRYSTAHFQKMLKIYLEKLKPTRRF